jgi:hypothetical protein
MLRLLKLIFEVFARSFCVRRDLLLETFALRQLGVWLGKIAICGRYTARLTWPASMSNSSHAAPAQTSVHLACPISVFTPRPCVGKAGPSAAALRLVTAAPAATVLGFRPVLLGDVDPALARMEADIGPCPTRDCCSR